MVRDVVGGGGREGNACAICTCRNREEVYVHAFMYIYSCMYSFLTSCKQDIHVTYISLSRLEYIVSSIQSHWLISPTTSVENRYVYLQQPQWLSVFQNQ